MTDEPPRITDGRRAFAIVAALLCPGAGHVTLGRPRRGLVAFALVWLAVLGVGLSLYALGTALVLSFGQMVDAALLRPARLRAWRFNVVVLLGGLVLHNGAQFAVRRFYVESFKIPSGSMIPTLLPGDHLFAEKWARRPRRGDVVLYPAPSEPDKTFVKRAIAIGGDTVEIRNGALVVNGTTVAEHEAGPCQYDDFLDELRRWETRPCRAVDETFDGRTWRVVYDPNGALRDFPPIKIPEGSAFVVGDNRDNSHDSRFHGPVTPIARVGYIWFSRGERVRWDRFNLRPR